MKKITARFISTCAETGLRIGKGEEMLYDYDTKKCYCRSSQQFNNQDVDRSTRDMVQANEEAYFDNLGNFL